MPWKRPLSVLNHRVPVWSFEVLDQLVEGVAFKQDVGVGEDFPSGPRMRPLRAGNPSVLKTMVPAVVALGRVGGCSAGFRLHRGSVVRNPSVDAR